MTRPSAKLSKSDKTYLKRIQSARFYRCRNGYRARMKGLITLGKAKALIAKGLIRERWTHTNRCNGAPFLQITGIAKDLMEGHHVPELDL